MLGLVIPRRPTKVNRGKRVQTTDAPVQPFLF